VTINRLNFLDLLDPKNIRIGLKCSDKEELLEQLFDMARTTKCLNNFEKFKKTLLEREHIQSTGLGKGIAIPHAPSDAVDSIFLVIGVCPKGVDFHSYDCKPCYVAFMIGSPIDDNREYLGVLAEISRIFRNIGVVDSLIEKTSPEEICQELKKRYIEFNSEANR